MTDEGDKRPPGRPRSVMTPQNEELICRAVAQGLPVNRAAQLVGTTHSTVLSHRSRNEEFATRLGQAIAHAQMDPIRKIRSAMDKSWRAAAWFLERSDPDNWALRTPDPATDDGSEFDERFL